MARRKRLTPMPMGGAPETASDTGPRTGLETKAMGGPGPAPLRSRAPIAVDAGAAASEAALAAISDRLEEARSSGRLAVALPIKTIDETHLTRDRIAVDPEEMTALIESLRRRGQQTPIEVVELGQGAYGGVRYGLISGWRRLTALRHLAKTEGGHDTILAVLRQPQDAAEAYVAMVEENEVRANLSHYERARIVHQAVKQEVFADSRSALRAFFGTASRSRRSKIGSFLKIVEVLDDVLAYPAALPERLGLALAKRLEETPDCAADLRAGLVPPAPDAETEQERIRQVLSGGSARGPEPEPEPAQQAPDTSAPPGIAPGKHVRFAAGTAQEVVLED
ncbi:MAG: ParB N-terminal domain-containing protein, partial [Pseudomonadota bacterium]